MFPGYYQSIISLYHFTPFSPRNLENPGAHLAIRKTFHCIVHLPGTHKGTSLLQRNELLCAAGEKRGLLHWWEFGSPFQGTNSTLRMNSSPYQRTSIVFYCSPPVNSKASLLNKKTKQKKKEKAKGYVKDCHKVNPWGLYNVRRGRSRRHRLLCVVRHDFSSQN